MNNKLLELQKLFKNNKAKGVLTEYHYKQQFPEEGVKDGCWILVQKGYNYDVPLKFALFFFLSDELSEKMESHKNVFRYLYDLGMELLVATHKNDEWYIYHYTDGKFKRSDTVLTQNFVTLSHNGDTCFDYDTAWEQDVLDLYNQLSPRELEEIYYKQILIYRFIRGTKRLWIDIHDVDGFIQSDDVVQPIEVKEKSRSKAGWIGVDINKIMLFAFFGTQGKYIVREIDRNPPRRFLRWLSIDFKEVVHFGSWTISEGGPSMYEKNTTTHTLSIPYKCFNEI